VGLTVLDKDPLAKFYNIVFLRHGQSLGNVESYYQGQTDFPLTEIGEKQSLALANRWASEGVHFNLIISSPLERAHQTAQIVGTVLDAPIEVDSVWMERDNGKLAGLKVDQAAEQYPRPDFIHPYLPIGETGESQWELYLRAGRAVSDLLRRPPSSYLLVSHGGILNMVMYVVLGLTPQANFQGARFRFRNAAFAQLQYHPDSHTWLLEALNDRSHYEEHG
jgi:broad specificity phosphatase PhoE